MSSINPTSTISLPPELLERVGDFLDLPDHLSLRQTCIYLCNSTLRPFAKSAFQTIRTDLSHQSFLRLDRVSSHPVFAPYIEVLVIRKPTRDATLGFGFHWHRHRASQYTASQLHLSSHGARSWYRVLQRLPNCRTLRVPFRDRHEVHLLDMVQYIGYDGAALTASDAVNLFLSFASRARRGLKELRLELRSESIYRGMQDLPGLLALPVNCPRFVAAVSTLETVHLSGCFPTTSHADAVHGLVAGAGEGLRSLTVKGQEDDYAVHFVNRLLEDCVGASAMPFRLQSLSLHHLSMLNGHALEKFLSLSAPHLRHLTLSNIVLAPGHPQTDNNNDDDEDDTGTKTWPSILETIRDSMSSPNGHLESISLFDLEGVPGYIMLFLDLDDPDNTGERETVLTMRFWSEACVGVSYEGELMDRALARIAALARRYRFQ
ncbi:hypothetical protein BJX61DRAFT_545483 [Aspergillus egyptiacus]|nr:hypothetical protein BJX61DRAFT_545483 [Aspergillus egyptiacus]